MAGGKNRGRKVRHSHCRHLPDASAVSRTFGPLVSWSEYPALGTGLWNQRAFGASENVCIRHRFARTEANLKIFSSTDSTHWVPLPFKVGQDEETRLELVSEISMREPDPYFVKMTISGWPLLKRRRPGPHCRAWREFGNPGQAALGPWTPPAPARGDRRGRRMRLRPRFAGGPDPASPRGKTSPGAGRCARRCGRRRNRAGPGADWRAGARCGSRRSRPART